jgi:hypothetical protein
VIRFIDDFPRPTVANEPYTGLRTALHAIWGLDTYKHPAALRTGLGWVEASAYIGIGSLLALLLVLLAWTIKIRKDKGVSLSWDGLFSRSPIILLALFVTFFILGMGNLGIISPYAFLHRFPVFSSMRVATRWLMWSSLFSLFIVASYKGSRFRRAIDLCLAAAVIELFVIGMPAISRAYFTRVQQYRPPTAQFDEVRHFQIPRPLYAPDGNFQKIYSYDENLYETTMNNYGQVIAGDALIDTRQPGTTIRCGANEKPSCPLISRNAKIIYWSPDRIVIKRLAAGQISLNINPGNGWTVNGKYIFKKDKVADPLQTFKISDVSQTIVLEYAPKLSPAWFSHSW